MCSLPEQTTVLIYRYLADVDASQKFFWAMIEKFKKNQKKYCDIGQCKDHVEPTRLSWVNFFCLEDCASAIKIDALRNYQETIKRNLTLCHYNYKNSEVDFHSPNGLDTHEPF